MRLTYATANPYKLAGANHALAGYDLYFEVAQTGKTAAEMLDAEKAELAAPVWRELAEWLAKTKE